MALQSISTITALVAVLLCTTGCAERRSYEFAGATMGTYYSVKVASVPAAMSERALAAAVAERVAEVDRLMSTYKENSELSRFNRAEVGEWFPLSRETAEVVALAQEVSELSGGAFDITVGPLVNLWGFGPEPATDRVPADAEIAAALAGIGFDRLALRAGSEPAIRKSSPLYVDLSAIAKGYAVDRVAAYLESRGIDAYLVDIGGEMRVAGTKEGGVAWRIAIQSPDGGGDNPHVLELPATGVATSGDYRNYFEVEGVRYSHTIDPRTGRPIRNSLASVTVLHPSATRADALATALTVMGLVDGMALAEQLELAVLFIVDEEGRFREYATSRFAPYLH